MCIFNLNENLDLEGPLPHSSSPDIPQPSSPPPDNTNEESADRTRDAPDQGSEDGDQSDAVCAPCITLVPCAVDLQTALEFIDALKAASLDNGDLDEEVLHWL